MKQQNNKGFSLVELMIVIAIIAILAAIAIPMYGSYTRDANLSSAQQAAAQARSIALSEDPTGQNFDSVDSVGDRIGALTNDTVESISVDDESNNSFTIELNQANLPGDSSETCDITYTAEDSKWVITNVGDDCDDEVVDTLAGSMEVDDDDSTD